MYFAFAFSVQCTDCFSRLAEFDFFLHFLGGEGELHSQRLGNKKFDSEVQQKVF